MSVSRCQGQRGLRVCVRARVPAEAAAAVSTAALFWL